MSSKAPDCPVNCSQTLRDLRFSVEKEDRPFCLVCRLSSDELRDMNISLDAHELSYERVDYWLSSDISPLCRKCHELVEAFKPKPRSHCETFAITAILAESFDIFVRDICQQLMDGRMSEAEWKECSGGMDIINFARLWLTWELMKWRTSGEIDLELNRNAILEKFADYQSGFSWLESSFGEVGKKYLAAQCPPSP